MQPGVGARTLRPVSSLEKCEDFCSETMTVTSKPQEDLVDRLQGWESRSNEMLLQAFLSHNLINSFLKECFHVWVWGKQLWKARFLRQTEDLIYFSEYSTYRSEDLIWDNIVVWFCIYLLVPVDVIAARLEDMERVNYKIKFIYHCLQLDFF